MTRFQQVLIEHAASHMPNGNAYCDCEFRGTEEEWARHVENRLNNAGLKVVEVYENKIGESDGAQ